MTRLLILIALLTGAAASARSQDSPAPSPAETAIRQNVASYVKAFNGRDAKALAEHWSPEAVYINRMTGEEVVGRAKIAEQFEALFKQQTDLKLEVSIESIRFLSPNVAVEQGTAAFLQPQVEPEEIEYTAVYVQRDGKWLLDRVTNETPLRDFWSDHPVWGAWAITRPFRWATWGMMDSWLGYGAQPYGYSYGENVYYQDGAVYSGDQQVATAEEYAQQAEDIAASAPETPPDQMQWMPLGVFALTQDGESSGAPPTLFLQLVISKQGVISGTFNNKATGETQTIEGAVDKATQRAAWGVEGKQRPIMETGLSNLTKDSAPALIHFDGGETQQWLMVRLPDPDQKG